MPYKAPHSYVHTVCHKQRKIHWAKISQIPPNEENFHFALRLKRLSNSLYIFMENFYGALENHKKCESLNQQILSCLWYIHNYVATYLLHILFVQLQLRLLQ